MSLLLGPQLSTLQPGPTTRAMMMAMTPSEEEEEGVEVEDDDEAEAGELEQRA